MKIVSSNSDKTTKPQQLHGKQLETLEDHTIVMYTDRSKLANGAVGSGWAVYNCGDQQLHRLTSGK